MLKVRLLSILKDSFSFLLLDLENWVLLVDSLKNHALENRNLVVKALLEVNVFYFFLFNELGVFLGTVFRSLSIGQLDLNVLALSFGRLWLFRVKL